MLQIRWDKLDIHNKESLISLGSFPSAHCPCTEKHDTLPWGIKI